MGMAGVTVTRGIEGFGREKRISSSRILDLSFHLPIIIEIIDSPEKIVEAIPEIREMMEEGLLMTTDVEVLKYGKEEIV
jgi:PII-like signaling protein